MLRSLWFWLTMALIVVGTALTVWLGVFAWLVAALGTAVLLIIAVFLHAAFAVGRARLPVLPQLEDVPEDEQIPVIHDCDLTMGRAFRDVGDGLALLYLLGEPRIALRAVTTTYGNGPVTMTTQTTRQLLRELELSDVGVYRGAGHRDERPEENEAARHLVAAVNARPNTVVLLATGSLTNLRHAASLDPDFFSKLRSLYLMGGVTGDLVWNRRRLMERNFSLDPAAAYAAIQSDCPTTIAPGEVGLEAIFRGRQFAALQGMDDLVSNLIVRKTRFWFALMKLWFQDGGFAMWESVAALCVAHPELFDFEQTHLPVTIEDLEAGRMVRDPRPSGPVRLVQQVKDYDAFINVQFAAWQRLGRRVHAERIGSL